MKHALYTTPRERAAPRHVVGLVGVEQLPAESGAWGGIALAEWVN
jgi:hypothetical protein